MFVMCVRFRCTWVLQKVQYPPLAMMGIALDRYLPGRYSMIANEIYVINFTKVYLCANCSNNNQLSGQIFSLYTLGGMAFYQI